MDATLIWRGDAAAVAHGVSIQPGELIVGRQYSLRINGKDITVTAGSTSASTFWSQMVDAIQNSPIPEWSEVTPTVLNGNLILTGTNPGQPFKVTGLVEGFTQGWAIVVRVKHSPTGGTWNFDAGAYGDEDIAYNANQAAGQTAMDTLFGSGNTLVTKTVDGTDQVWTIEGRGTQAGVPVPDVTVTYANLTGGDAALTVTVVQEAQAGTDCVQTLDFAGSPTSGTRTFEIARYNETGEIVDAQQFTVAYDASAATIQTAARALPNVNGANVNVTGTANTQMVFTFTAAWGHRPVPPIKVYSDVSGGTIYADVVVDTEGAPAVNTIHYIWHREWDAIQMEINLDKNTFSSWSGGSWGLTINGDNTNAIPYDATNSEIAAILEAFFTDYGVIVSSANGWITIRGVGHLFSKSLNSVSVTSAITGGSVDLTSFTSGSTNTDGNAETAYKIKKGATQTAYVQPTDSVATIQAAMDAAFGAGYTVVTGLEQSGSLYSRFGLYSIEWKGPYAGSTVYITIEEGVSGVNTIDRDTYQTGVPGGGVNEVVILEVHGSPTWGDFFLGFGGFNTAAILPNDTALTVQTRVRDLPNVSDTGFTGTGGPLDSSPVTLTAGGEYSFTDIGPFTVNDDNLKTRVTMTTAGVQGQDEIQKLSLSGQDIWAGDVTITIVGDTVSALPYNSALAAVIDELETSVGLTAGDLNNSYGGPWPENDIYVVFGGSKTETNVALITATDTFKNGTATAVSYDPLIITTTAKATGPNHFNDPVNWYNPDSPATVKRPERQDKLYYTEGRIDCLYGLKQMVTFTADTTNDLLVISEDHDLEEGQVVEVWSEDTLPGGVTASTSYYVVALDPITGNFGLSTELGGAKVNLTSAGTGPHWVGVRLTKLVRLATHTGKLGLPWWNKQGYKEYRPLDLVIGVQPPAGGVNKVFTIGQGSGNSSPMVNLDTRNEALTLECLSSAGSPEPGVPAVKWKGDNPLTEILLLGGDFGIAARPTETAECGPIEMRGGTFAGGVFTATTFDKTGGSIVRVDEATFSGIQKIRA